MILTELKNEENDNFLLTSLIPKYVIHERGEKENFNIKQIKETLIEKLNLSDEEIENVLELIVQKIIGMSEINNENITTNSISHIIGSILCQNGFGDYNNLLDKIENKKCNSFHLNDQFIEKYKNIKPDWGPIGELTFKRTYARPVEGENRTEEWYEVVRRCVEGCFSIQKEYCNRKDINLDWDEKKARKSAKAMYKKIFNFKFTPPGRGLWIMGTPFVQKKGSMALNNCGFASTEDIKRRGSLAFRWCMDASMLGVGVGYDTLGAGTLIIQQPIFTNKIFVIPDSREGWVEATGIVIDGYFFGNEIPKFDFSKIRKKGEPIKGFGGKASGPEPLKDLLKNIGKKVLDERIGQYIKSTDIVDIMNLIGKTVVAGNVRRCISSNMKVQTFSGSIPIDQITTTNKVLVSDGSYQKVKNVFKQGRQEVIEIVTPMGSIKCTPNHRVAIYNSLESYKWKFAEDLTSKDRLISIVHDKGKKSISEKLAWLIGYYHGDGYADIKSSKKRNGGGGTVSFAMSKKNYDNGLKEKFDNVLNSIYYEAHPCHDGNSTHVNVYRKDFAEEMLQYRKPHQMPIIPKEIWEGDINIRSSYLAGLCDSDGGTRNTLVWSKYPEFCKQIQSIALSLGIASTFHTRSNKKIVKGKEYDPDCSVTIRGIQSQKRAKELIEPYTAIWECQVKKVKKNGLSLPFELLLDARKQGIKFNYRIISPNKHGQFEEIDMGDGTVQLQEIKYSDANFDTLIEQELVNENWLPIEILEIKDAGIEETYDIEVEGDHEFVCENFLVHNSAQIALGSIDDHEFITMKQDYDKVADFRQYSNNSVVVSKGIDYRKIVEGIVHNGEPGIINLDNARKYSRTGREPDYKDSKVMGVNPCGEQFLESFETCCLIETYPSRHESYEEYEETLKYAYLYGKSVTLLNTHWGITNAVMLKNRRIGTSQTGIWDFIQKFGLRECLRWCDQGYDYLKKIDKQYSEDWLCVPMCNKITSVKPSGTTSLLPGVNPGIHPPHSEYHIRRIRLAKNSKLIPLIKEAGYHIEDDVSNENNYVIECPIHIKTFKKSKYDVSVFEQFALLAAWQKHWSDNAVSITITFTEDEIQDVIDCLELYEDEIKGVSFLMLDTKFYPQSPYETITKEQFEEMNSKIKDIDFSNHTEAGEGVEGCKTDACELKKDMTEIKKAQNNINCLNLGKSTSILGDGFCLDNKGGK